MSKRAKPSCDTSPTKRAKKQQGVEVGPYHVDPIGFGSMLLGIEYPDPKKRPAKAAAIELLHTAFRAGVELIDTADSYYAGPGGSKEADSPHYVEALISEAIATFPGDASRVRVCTKGGMQRINSASNGWRPRVCSATSVRQMAAESRKALGGEKPLDMWMLHHTDALNPKQLEEVLLAMQDMLNSKEVLALGLANATVPNLDLAERLGIRISAVQNQYSLWQPEAGVERPAGAAASNRKGVLLWCASRGVAFMPYGVFGGVQSRDGRRNLLQSFPQLAGMAAAKATSPQALVLAWMRQRFPNIVHIVGARGRQNILDCAHARSLELSVDELDAVTALKPARGSIPKAPASQEAYVYLERGWLSGASKTQQKDFEEDMRKFSAGPSAKGKWTIVMDAVADRLCVKAVSGGDSGIILPAAFNKSLDEVIQFHFGKPVPR